MASDDPREIVFTQKSPGWENEGVEPRLEKKQAGFEAGYKPPAGYFNWFWTRVSRCINELQAKLAAYAGANESDKASINAAKADKTTVNSALAAKADVSYVNTALAGKADASALSGHSGRTDNPHGVTKAQVGLGNVSNLTDADRHVGCASKISDPGTGKKKQMYTKSIVASTDGIGVIWLYDITDKLASFCCVVNGESGRLDTAATIQTYAPPEDEHTADYGNDAESGDRSCIHIFHRFRVMLCVCSGSLAVDAKPGVEPMGKQMCVIYCADAGESRRGNRSELKLHREYDFRRNIWRALA